MRISYQWLQDYIKLDHSPDTVVQTLTRLGLEVESVERQGVEYDGFCIAKVLDVQKHPKADRLKVCLVQTHNDAPPLQVVCGAPNVAAGQNVIVGVAGAVVPHNQHDPGGKPFVLSKAVIRGVESHGMICSAKELGLGEDASGIMTLGDDAVVGTPLATYLGLTDTSMEIGITPNRPDCLSHIGIARDLAAAFGTEIRFPEVRKGTSKHNGISSLTSVELRNTHDCPRYTVRLIRNITVNESPKWMQQRLIAAGLRPINAVVDVTNYVMLEYGQPLHAFDFDRLSGQRIVVKSAEPGEQFVTLDGKKHTLTGSELMICDGERSVALGGVMGGENSEISVETKHVLLESAYFSPTSIRRTSKKLGISTDASYRFERGIDPNMTAIASERAASLIAELTGGTVIDGCIDIYPHPIEPREIAVRPHRVNDLLGTALSAEEMMKIVRALGISILRESGDSIQCRIPTYRPDIEQEIDVIEEIARLYGYDRIGASASGHVLFSAPDQTETRRKELRSWLEANGIQEVMTNSMIDAATAALFTNEPVTVMNPLSQDLAVMRPSLASTMLQSVAYNLNHGAEEIRFFELGTVFARQADADGPVLVPGYREHSMLGLCLSGYSSPMTWHEKRRKIDFFDLKGLVVSLLRGIGLDNSNLIYYNAPSSLTELTIAVEINGTYVGSFGRCSRAITKQYKIDQDVWFAELDLDVILHISVERRFQEFSRFPTVVRDIAFIVSETHPAGDIESVIRSEGGPLITSVTLFDLFEGASLGEGKKSIAFSVSMNAVEKTLTEAEIDAVVHRIIERVTQTFSATLRSL